MARMDNIMISEVSSFMPNAGIIERTGPFYAKPHQTLSLNRRAYRG